MSRQIDIGGASGAKCKVDGKHAGSSWGRCGCDLALCQETIWDCADFFVSWLLIWHRMCNDSSIMKHFTTLSALLLLLVMMTVASPQAKAQSTPDEAFGKIAAAIQGGNVDALAAFFNTTVELTLPTADESYSAQQAAFILKDFFAKNAPKSFSVIHKGTSGATEYATGTFVSGGGTYDTNIFLKNVGGVFKVSQLRFEAE
jgi:Domain of unknown function (DUF4783)